MVDSHQKWLATVPAAPDVIAMTFVPIASLISGIPGNGYLSRAVNLYLQCTDLPFSVYFCSECRFLFLPPTSFYDLQVT